MAETAEMEKRKAPETEKVERTRNEPVYAPAVDIMETDEYIMVVADMPGVDEKNAEVTLENDILAIEGRQELSAPEGYEQAYAEFVPGVFSRAFSLTSEVDKNGIEAEMRNGVLRVKLPRAEKAGARKIPVKAS